MTLAEQGVREITFLGQNVNAYRGEMHEGGRCDLGLLITYASAIDGIDRIRYTTSHPSDVDQSLIRAHAEVPELASQLHLPVQSGSDRILELMKRNYRSADYIETVRRLREARPDLSLSSDFIVGFPGETERDFDSTMELIETLRFDGAFSFIYSPRPGTPAAELADPVPLAVKKRRLAVLQARVAALAHEVSRSMVGSTQRVLVEGESKKDASEVCGAHREHARGELSRRPVSPRALRGCGDKRGPAQLASGPSVGRRRAGPIPFFVSGTDVHHLPLSAQTASACAQSRCIALEPADNRRLAELCGPFDQHLRQLERRLGVEINSRGNEFSVRGDAGSVRTASEVIRRLYEATDREALSAARVHLYLQEAGLADIASPEDEVVVEVRRGQVQSRGPNQARYLRNIRTHDINFGIGPAGTGKTYLAVACAVEALQSERARRMVLVRPAVEAGERLGFLPGDLAQKVDPYLRPLYDALWEMLGFERVGKLIDRNVIEVAPLAYMRGPHPQRVLHHSRRGAEHFRRADEDVPDPNRLRFHRGRDRRHHADRSASGQDVRPPARNRRARRDRRHRLHLVQFPGRRPPSAGSSNPGCLPGLRTPDRSLRGRVRMEVEVQIASEADDVPSSGELKRWARAALQVADGAPPECTLRVVGEREGAMLNERFRRGRGATNVLAFPFESPPGVSLPNLGDVVVCAPVVRREACDHGLEGRAHWAHLVVHGVLHLLGHDHCFDEEAERMRAEESRILGALGFEDPHREESTW